MPVSFLGSGSSPQIWLNTQPYPYLPLTSFSFFLSLTSNPTTSPKNVDTNWRTSGLHRHFLPWSACVNSISCEQLKALAFLEKNQDNVSPSVQPHVPTWTREPAALASVPKSPDSRRPLAPRNPSVAFNRTLRPCPSFPVSDSL